MREGRREVVLERVCEGVLPLFTCGCDVMTRVTGGDELPWLCVCEREGKREGERYIDSNVKLKREKWFCFEREPGICIQNSHDVKTS